MATAQVDLFFQSEEEVRMKGFHIQESRPTAAKDDDERFEDSYFITCSFSIGENSKWVYIPKNWVIKCSRSLIHENQGVPMPARRRGIISLLLISACHMQ